ncbi:MAG: glycosyltransferase, partial [Proteobacteria bacterium]|nr:glycosyltransferase [Pseudomonadota bacterium]
MNKSISIIVNATNRSDALLNATLQSISCQGYENFEIILISDSLHEIYADGNNRIQCVYKNQSNLSSLRNMALSVASGELVAFIDCGSIAEPEWLSQIAAAFVDQSVAGVSGSCFDQTGCNLEPRFLIGDRLGNFGICTKVEAGLGFPFSFIFPCLRATNMAFRRNILLQLGGFDQRYRSDYMVMDICLRLVDSGQLIRHLAAGYVHNKISELTFDYNDKVLFSNLHAQSYYNQVEIDQDNRKYLAREMDRISKYQNNAVDTNQDKINFTLLPKLPLNKKQVIVFLSYDYPPNLSGGIARFTQDLATALAQLGHTIHVITKSFQEINTVDYENGVWVHRVIIKHFPLTAEAIDKNIPQFIWDISGTFLSEIDRIAHYRAINVVQAPIWDVLGISILLSKRYKLITSLHTTLAISYSWGTNQNPEHYQNFVAPMINLEKYMLENSDHLLANSQAIIKQVVEVYKTNIPEGKISIVQHGSADWYKQVETNSTKDTLNLLFVGRLEKRKGIDILLSIVPRLCHEFPNLRVNIVGEDSIPIMNQK